MLHGLASDDFNYKLARKLKSLLASIGCSHRDRPASNISCPRSTSASLIQSCTPTMNAFSCFVIPMQFCSSNACRVPSSLGFALANDVPLCWLSKLFQLGLHVSIGQPLQCFCGVCHPGDTPRDCTRFLLLYITVAFISRGTLMLSEIIFLANLLQESNPSVRNV